MPSTGSDTCAASAGLPTSPGASAAAAPPSSPFFPSGTRIPAPSLQHLWDNPASRLATSVHWMPEPRAGPDPPHLQPADQHSQAPNSGCEHPFHHSRVSVAQLHPEPPRSASQDRGHRGLWSLPSPTPPLACTPAPLPAPSHHHHPLPGPLQLPPPLTGSGSQHHKALCSVSSPGAVLSVHPPHHPMEATAEPSPDSPVGTEPASLLVPASFPKTSEPGGALNMGSDSGPEACQPCGPRQTP